LGKKTRAQVWEKNEEEMKSKSHGERFKEKKKTDRSTLRDGLINPRGYGAQQNHGRVQKKVAQRSHSPGSII